MLKPGECDSSGNIQSPDPAAADAAGLVIIKREQLPAALKHGWEEVPIPSHISTDYIATNVYLDPNAELVAVKR